MFSKSTAKDTTTPGASPKIEPAAAPAPTPAPAPSASVAPTPGEAARKGPRVASLIAEHLTVEGGISGEGDLQVDGSVRGDIRMGKVTIGESGQVEGSIQAELIEIRGRVTGVMTAKQVRLIASAYVDGDITHEQLSIEAGAFFQGRSLKFQRAVAAPATVQAPVREKAPAADLSVPAAPSASKPN